MAHGKLADRFRICKNPLCGRSFEINVGGAGIKYCSKVCGEIVAAANPHRPRQTSLECAAIRLGFLDACLVYFHNCRTCGSAFTTRKGVTRGYGINCPACRPLAQRAVDARKNQRRRAVGPPVLSVLELAKRDGARCNLCGKRVDMSLSGMAKWGPTIDHLVPVSKGGTNDPDNLALAHRHCNVSRNNRGIAQLLLAV